MKINACKMFIETPLGSMIAIANDEALLFLEFADSQLPKQFKSTVVTETNAPLVSIEQELKYWFDGTLKTFKTPIYVEGSSFQQKVWNELCQIPYGETRSYLEQATSIGRPTACRAVANANGANRIAIVIPCHRIINSNGGLGGYAGGIERKQWLINHEKQHR